MSGSAYAAITRTTWTQYAIARETGVNALMARETGVNALMARETGVNALMARETAATALMAIAPCGGPSHSEASRYAVAARVSFGSSL